MEEPVFTAECTDMNEMGAGIVRTGGMVVFVPGLIPGERAEIAVTGQKKSYAFGKIVRRITSSDERIPALCPDAEECGGCTLGHISFDAENRIKRSTVLAALRKAGLGDLPVEPVLHDERRYGYRNKMSLRYDPATRAFGYCRPGTEEVLPFHGCPLCPSLFSDIALFLNGSPECMEPLSPHSLKIRSGENGILVSIGAAEGSETGRKALTDRIRTAFPEVSGVYFDGRGTDAAGLTDHMAGLSMRFSAEAFRQVNTPVFELLLGELLSMAAEEPFARAADLYCGSGIIGLALAKAFPDARVTGIELNPEAIEDAKKNAALNGLGSIRFFAGDAAGFRQRIRPADSPDLIVIDPPRAGLSKEVRRDLTTLSPERIIYVSCNPQTLARDLGDLTREGYAVRRVLPVNMFPVTKHVETVCCLYRQKKDYISVPYGPKNADYLKQLK